MPRFISHPGSRKKRNTYKRSHKRGHNKRSGTRKQRGGRGGGAGIAGASGHGALTTGASQVAAQLSPASYEDDD